MLNSLINSTSTFIKKIDFFLWSSRSINIYHCNLVTISNLVMRILLELYTILTSFITPFLNKITWTELWEVKSLQISFPPHSFSLSVTVLVMYVSCEHIMSYFLCLKYVNIDFHFSFDWSPQMENSQSVESQAIWKIHVQKWKSVAHTQQAVYSISVTQLGCDMELCMDGMVSLACFLLMLMLPGESPVSDIVHLSLASCLHCS